MSNPAGTIAAFIDLVSQRRVPLDQPSLAQKCESAPDLPTALDDGDRRARLYILLTLGHADRDAPRSFSRYATANIVTPALHDASMAAAEAVVGALAKESSTSATTAAECAGLLNFLVSKTDGGHTLTQLPAGLQGMLRQTLRVTRHHDEDSRMRTTFVILQQLWSRYTPSVAFAPHEVAFGDLSRLVLQYHDPVLSVHLDRHQASVSRTLVQHLRGLFAPDVDDEVQNTMALWDAIVTSGDALMPLFLALAYISRRRETLLDLTGTDLQRTLDNMSMSLGEGGDTMASTASRDHISLARQLLRSTPPSTRQTLNTMLFSGTSIAPTPLRAALKDCAVLPLDPADLLATVALNTDGHVRPSAMSYVVLDCRSEASFSYARFPTAIHIGNELAYDPEALHALRAKLSHAAGSHMTILGTGRGIVDELNLLTLLALQLVQGAFAHISMLRGGFKACIPALRSGKYEYTSGVGVVAPPSAGGGDAAARAGSRRPSESLSMPTPPTTDKVGELRERAAASFAAAVGWGHDTWRVMSERISRPNATTIPVGTAPSQNSAASAGSLGSVAQHAAGDTALFAWAVEDDDDDLGLITGLAPTDALPTSASPTRPTSSPSPDAAEASSPPATDPRPPRTAGASPAWPTKSERHPFDDIFDD